MGRICILSYQQKQLVILIYRNHNCLLLLRNLMIIRIEEVFIRRINHLLIRDLLLSHNNQMILMERMDHLY
jgi:hypothetical protein